MQVMQVMYPPETADPGCSATLIPCDSETVLQGNLDAAMSATRGRLVYRDEDYDRDIVRQQRQSVSISE